MSLTIRAAHVRDLKAIREASLSKLDNLVLIGGKNGAGKTGLLSVLAGAVGFPWPDDLLRDGKDKGEAEVHLTDGDETFVVAIAVRRAKNRAGQYTGKINTTLTITGFDKERGAYEIKRPRDWLKARLSGKHFDVLAAIDEFDTPKGERAVLERMREAAGLDFADLDAQAEAARTARRDAGRDLKQAEGARDAIPPDPQCPEPVDVAGLIVERDATKATNDAIDTEVFNAERVLAEVKGRVAEFTAELRALEDNLDKATRNQTQWEVALGKAQAKEKQDTTSLDEQIGGAETVNARVRQQAMRKMHGENVAALEKAVGEDDARLHAITERKRSLLATADFGVPGLTLSDDLTTILYEGEPLRRLSDGNKIAVFAMLAAAQNPDIGVLFSTRASLLDDEHLAFCDDVAKEMGMQFILEVVGSREGAIVIEATEDGSVVTQEAKDDS